MLAEEVPYFGEVDRYKSVGTFRGNVASNISAKYLTITNNMTI